MSQHLAIVIPAMNEGSRVAAVLDAIPRSIGACARVSLIVVDDGSADDTATVAANRARVVSHVINLGKGAALTTGCEVAHDAGADLIAVMDADGQHRPEDLPALVEPLSSGRADLTVACRSLSREMPWAMRIGNWGLSEAFNVLFGARFQDTQCGLRAFTRDAYEVLRWRSTGYSVETEMLVHAARRGLRVVEVPITTIYHDRYKGTTVFDGVHILGDMLRWRLQQVG